MEYASNIRDFGAVGDGVNDDTKAVQDAIDNAVETGRYVVFMPPGVYRIKNRISLKSHVVLKGIRGKSKILISDFLDTKSEGILTNEHLSRAYNPDTADEITIDGIDFEFTRVTTNHPKTILFLANTQRATIQNCSFLSTNPFAKTETTHLDLYACCKNTQILNCDFIHINEGIGGCIWVRNLTSATSNLNGDITSNVEIAGCRFVKSSEDEIIAVFSTRGDVRDVSIHDNTFRVTRDARMSFPFSIYPADNNYHGGVENVTFAHNSVYMERINTFVFMLGREGRTNPCRRISIKNNRFFVTIPDKVTVSLFYGNKPITDTRFEDNYLEVHGVPESKVNNTCVNIQDVHGNTIKGSPEKILDYGIVRAQCVTHNVLEYVRDAISMCRQVSHNTISHCRHAITYSGEEDVIVSDNIISQCKQGIIINGKTDAIASNNIITLDSEESSLRGIRIEHEKAWVTAMGNVITTYKKGDCAFCLVKGHLIRMGNIYKRNPAGEYQIIREGSVTGIEGYTLEDSPDA
jgi:hypothetical protein